MKDDLFPGPPSEPFLVLLPDARSPRVDGGSVPHLETPALPVRGKGPLIPKAVSPPPSPLSFFLVLDFLRILRFDGETFSLPKSTISRMKWGNG